MSAAAAVVQAADEGDAIDALEALDRHCVLCAHRRGSRGVSWWTARMQQWIADDLDLEPRPDGR